MKNERKIQKLEAIRRHKLAHGEEVIEENDQLIEMKKAHYGRNLLDRIQTHYLIDEQIKFQIEEKKALRNKLLSEHNEEEVKKIEDDLEKLHEVFTKVNPKKKYVTNFDANLSKKDERN